MSTRIADDQKALLDSDVLDLAEALAELEADLLPEEVEAWIGTFLEPTQPEARLRTTNL